MGSSRKYLEPVYPVDLLGLVVPPGEEEMPRVEQLEGEEEEEDLGGPGAAVHKVTVEQVLMEERRMPSFYFSAFCFVKIVEVYFLKYIVLLQWEERCSGHK